MRLAREQKPEIVLNHLNDGVSFSQLARECRHVPIVMFGLIFALLRSAITHTLFDNHRPSDKTIPFNLPTELSKKDMQNKVIGR